MSVKAIPPFFPATQSPRRESRPTLRVKSQNQRLPRPSGTPRLVYRRLLQRRSTVLPHPQVMARVTVTRLNLAPETLTDEHRTG